MTPEAQRIAIAEALGWKGMDFATNNVTNPKGLKQFYNGCLKSWEDFVPDYLNDLNAMHEAEETLFGIERENYARMLTGAGLLFYPVAHANAAKRAEAFLRVKGLWK